MSVPRKSIADIFYETRTSMGRDYTVRRFAAEVLGGSVETVMLSYIEKGERFPSEALVRRLATVRDEDPRSLLAALARDRMLAAAGKELKKVLSAPKALGGIEDGELAVRVSQAIAGLPDDGDWINTKEWREEFSAAPKRQKNKKPLTKKAAREIEAILVEQEIAEVKGERVRRQARHYVAEGVEQRQALAIEYCSLFLTSLLDCVTFEEPDTNTYLRNHYFNIDSDRIPEFQKKLDAALRALAEEFAVEKSDASEFMNILTSGVLFR